MKKYEASKKIEYKTINPIILGKQKYLKHGGMCVHEKILKRKRIILKEIV